MNRIQTLPTTIVDVSSVQLVAAGCTPLLAKHNTQTPLWTDRRPSLSYIFCELLFHRPSTRTCLRSTPYVQLIYINMFRRLAVKRRSVVVTLLLVVHVFLAKYPPMDIRNSLVHSPTGAGPRSNALNDVCGVCTHHVEVSGDKRWQWLGSRSECRALRLEFCASHTSELRERFHRPSTRTCLRSTPHM